MQKFQLIVFYSINLWLVLILASCLGPQEIDTRNYTESGGSIQVKSGALPSVWPYAIDDIVVDEGVAYIAAGEQGLQILDVSDPTNPSPLRRIDFFSRSNNGNNKLKYEPSALHLHGKILYVAGGCFPGMLFALDLSQPTAVLPLWSYGLTCGGSIDTSADKISVANNYSGLLLLDRSDPATTRVLGPVARPEAELVFHSAIYGNFALMGTWNPGFRTSPVYLVNITNPAHIVVIKEDTDLLANNDTLQFFRHGGQLYQLMRQRIIIRQFDPSAPSQNFFEIKELAGDRLQKAVNLFVTDNYLYVVGPDSGLTILDIADPAAVKIGGTYTATLKAASTIWVENNIAFVGDRKAGFQILDVAKPAAPQLLYMSEQ